jgi:hypothetical protein
MSPRRTAQAPRQAGRLARLANKALLARTGIDYEEQNLMRNFELLMESADLLTTALDATPRNPEDVISLRHQYAEDYQIAKTQLDKVGDLRNTLNSIEFQLQAKEQEIRDCLETLSPEARDGDAASSSSEGASSRALSSEIPPVLERYYDRKGDEGIQKERLADLDYYYYEGLAQRELVADQGDPLEVSDEDFNTEYIMQRQNILTELDAATQDVQTLAEQCRKLGININRRRRLPPEDDASLAPVDDIQIIPPPFVHGDMLQNIKTSQFAGQQSADAVPPSHVQDWLDTVSIDAGVPGNAEISGTDEGVRVGSVVSSSRRPTSPSSDPLAKLSQDGLPNEFGLVTRSEEGQELSLPPTSAPADQSAPPKAECHIPEDPIDASTADDAARHNDR